MHGGGTASTDQRRPGIVTKWLAKGRLFWYRPAMSKLLEIEAALGQLPRQEQWEVARWLLDALEQGTGSAAKGQKDGSATALPDYTARRRRIFGDKVLPNRVLVSTSLLFSLYSTDANSPKADAWRMANPAPLPFTAFHRLELRNALNLAVFQKRLTPVEVQSAW